MMQRCKIEFASSCVADLALSNRSQPSGAQKPVDRGLWGTNAGTPPFLGSIRLNLGNAFANDREATRRDIAAQACRRDLGGGKFVAQQSGKIRDRTLLHPRRDLFAQ